MTAFKVLTVVGTRPEAIKMAPVIMALERSAEFESCFCVTAQHREMLDQVLELFSLEPDHDLDLMRAGQSLADITRDVLAGVGKVLEAERPDLVLVQGDTTTSFVSALAAFYGRTPVGHVEAGLRTGDLAHPYPEEANRQLTSRLADLHFAPTEGAAQNLHAEGIDPERVFVTGNTVIDALFSVREKAKEEPAGRWRDVFGEALYERLNRGDQRLVLITGHRRENFGEGFSRICQAIRGLAQDHPGWFFLYPVHLNPNVRRPVFDILGGLENVSLIEPVDYLSFVWLMDRSCIILTDSGGIQEEAPSLGKPVLVMREVTERPEAVDAGTVILVGTDEAEIISRVEALLEDRTLYETMSRTHNPYGDGQAARRILEFLKTHLLSVQQHSERRQLNPVA